jgi:flagellar hook-associated protein 1 FlgK
MSSTFDGLYIARSGVRASRANLNITGQNITNADTEGYTRQRVDQSSLPPSEYGGFWASSGASCGNGVAATGTSQLRDAFLDGEYRTQNAKSGESSSELSAMYNMEDIFTATTTASSSSDSSVIDVLSNEFSNLVSQLQALTSGKSSASESAIREEAKLLTTKLNTAAKALETIRSQQYTNLNKYGIQDADDLLKNIASLNDRIKDAEISGSPALELKDQRNLLLDKLSQYTNIKVVETPVDVGSGRKVDQLSVVLADTDGNPLKGTDGQEYTLVDGKQYAQFSSFQDKVNEDGTPATGTFDITHVRLSGLTADGVTFPVTTSSGSVYRFQADGGAVQTITIPADTYADQNALKAAVQAQIDANGNLGGVTVGVSDDGTRLTFSAADGKDLSVQYDSGDDALNLNGMKNSGLQSGSFAGYLKLLNESGEYDTKAGEPTTTMRGIGFYSQLLDGIARGLASTMNTANSTNDTSDNRPLMAGFDGAGSESPDAADITAENIHISSAWTDGYLTMSKGDSNAGDDTSTSYSNITDMIAALTGTEQHFVNNAADQVTIFDGTLQKAFASVGAMLGQDVNSVQSTDNTNASLLNNIDSDRQSLSSVSIDDEAINLVQFNQSLVASSRFMTAVDECLQTIINNMGLAGRG